MEGKNAFLFIVLLGLVSLFADITYEGARGIVGPFAKSLGASAAALGFAVGLGEMIGYALRLLSGVLADRTGKYWFLTAVGYGVNLFAVPMLAFAGNWHMALALIIAERFGKALRTPARDTLLSFASEQVGLGKSFGIHEALDQIGAISGPLLLAFSLALGKDYKFCFLLLFIPALVALGLLLIARFTFPSPPRRYKEKGPPLYKLGGTYWLYLLIVSMVAFGFVDFPLIAYHVSKLEITKGYLIPAAYSFAMAIDALSALIFGFLFDKKGFSVLFYAITLSAFSPLFSFSTHFPSILAGVALWGIGMGAQESVMRAAIAKIVPQEKRAFAYGVFFAGYGTFWFLGSWIMGILYDMYPSSLITISLSVQLAAGLLVLRFKEKTTEIGP